MLLLGFGLGLARTSDLGCPHCVGGGDGGPHAYAGSATGGSNVGAGVTGHALVDVAHGQLRQFCMQAVNQATRQLGNLLAVQRWIGKLDCLRQVLLLLERRGQLGKLLAPGTVEVQPVQVDRHLANGGLFGHRFVHGVTPVSVSETCFSPAESSLPDNLPSLGLRSLPGSVSLLPAVHGFLGTEPSHLSRARVRVLRRINGIGLILPAGWQGLTVLLSLSPTSLGNCQSLWVHFPGLRLGIVGHASLPRAQAGLHRAGLASTCRLSLMELLFPLIHLTELLFPINRLSVHPVGRRLRALSTGVGRGSRGLRRWRRSFGLHTGTNGLFSLVALVQLVEEA